MRVYYMTSARVALLVLRERRMKLSLFDELNDPFELLAVALGDRLMRRVVRALHAHWSKTKGVICFSDNWRSPVMWAHYGDKHRGACLGFDIPDAAGVLSPITYNPERLLRVLDEHKPLYGLDEEFVKAALLTKSAEWAYEREYRVLADLRERGANGYYYVDFGPMLQLREVILGVRNEASVGAYARAVGKPDKSVQVLRARAAFNEFAMVRNKAVAAINVKGSEAD